VRFLFFLSVSAQVMAEAANSAEFSSGLGLAYDRVCRYEWSQRANSGEPGFDVNKVWAFGAGFFACVRLLACACVI